jgi:hypothetical protein
MDETRKETEGGAEGERETSERSRPGEQRTTVKAEEERLRAAEATQREHPDAFAGHGRATGEPPLDASDEHADPRDPTT